VAPTPARSLCKVASACDPGRWHQQGWSGRPLQRFCEHARPGHPRFADGRHQQIPGWQGLGGALLLYLTFHLTTSIAASQLSPARQPRRRCVHLVLAAHPENSTMLPHADLRHLVSGPRRRHQPVLQGLLRGGRHPSDDSRHSDHSRRRGRALPLDGEQRAIIRAVNRS
jgi:hypothetical protein